MADSESSNGGLIIMAKFCTNCGVSLPDAAKFCSGCGAKQDALPVQRQQPLTPPQPPELTQYTQPELPLQPVSQQYTQQYDLQQPAPQQYIQQPQPQLQPQPPAPRQYTQQPQPQLQPQPPAPPPPPPMPLYPYTTAKKRSKAPFIIAGAGVLAVTLAVVLIVTNVFGITGSRDDTPEASESSAFSFDQERGDFQDGGYTFRESDGAVFNDDGELVFYYTGDDDAEVFMVPYMEEDKELILEWLESFLDADEYFETVYGKSYLTPIEVVGEATDRLGSYRAANGSGGGQAAGDFDSDGDGSYQGSDDDYMTMDVWPTEQLPDGMPVYPDGDFDVIVLYGAVYIYVSGSSQASFEIYIDMLSAAGWKIDDSEPDYTFATKGSYTIVLSDTGSSLMIYFY